MDEETRLNEMLQVPKIKCAAYARFSSDNQREESIDAQMRYITTFAAERNYEITKFYIDRAHSGRNLNCPAMQQLIKDSESGDFTVILCHKMDRISRNVQDVFYLVDTLQSRGIRIISTYEQFQATPSGRSMLSISSSINQYYSENLASEVEKGQRENALKELSNGGIGCLGYNIVDKKYVINEEEAKAVKLIFQMAGEGYGYNSIIDKLNNLGYKTKVGRPFGKNSLYSILNNEKYAGTFVFNKIARGNFRGKRNSHKYKPESEIIRIENGMPAIISKELWNRVQAIRKINPKGKSHNKYFYLLSGLVYCGECGAKFHGNPRNTGNGGPVYVTYRCNHRDNNHSCNNKEVRREYVEGFVIEELFRHFFNDDTVPKITQQLNEKLKQDWNKNDDEYLQYQASMKIFEKSRANLIETIEKTCYSKALGDKLKVVEAQIETCSTFLKQNDERRGNVPVFTEDQVEQNLSKLKEFAKTSHREEVRAMVQNYVERVTVFRDRIEVVFKVAFDSNTDKPITYNCESSLSRNELD